MCKISTQNNIQWLKSDVPRAVKLREQLGLTETTEEKVYADLLDMQHNKNFSHIRTFVQKRCSHVKYKLSSWNTKSWGDSFKYAVSIMSTVGMGSDI